MANTNLATTAILLLFLSASGAAAPAGERGCTVLAQRIKASVVAAAGAPALAGRLPRDVRHGSAVLPLESRGRARHTCSATAAVASRAFSEAVSGLDVRLSWNGGWIRPGDTCLSHYLSQCYPTHDPLSPLPPPGQFAFVQQAWQRVAQALVSQMPYGPRGDLASFSDESLAEALGGELGTLRLASRPPTPGR